MDRTRLYDLAIIGGGITGLATAYLASRERPGLRLVVLEAGHAVGGKARTTVRDGYTVDWGPNGFLTSAPETLQLARMLGLDDDLQAALDTAQKRYLYRDGGLRPLPTSPSTFLRSELVSWPGKLRAVLELALAGRHDEEETVHAFLARHFGRELADALAGPLVQGTTAGDPRQLSLDALFPRMRQLERDHGSVLRALIAQQARAAKARKAAARAVAGDPAPAGPDGAVAAPEAAAAEGPAGAVRARGRLTSFRAGGIQHLVDALQRELGDRVRTDARVVRLEPAGDAATAAAEGHALVTAAGERIAAACVVITTPTDAAAELLEPHRPEAARALRGIGYAGVRVFGLGFDRVDVPRVLDGFGFLPVASQGVRSLGVLWTSAIFPDRAPAGKVLLRVLAGGSNDPAMLELPEEDALACVRRDLERTMGIVAEPEFREVITWPRAIPQYTLGHAARVEAIDEALDALPGVLVAGNAYRGVGLNDSVRDAARTVGRIPRR